MSAISAREPVLAAFTPVGDGVVVEVLLILRVLPGVFALGRGWLTTQSLWTNITYFCCHPFF